jgi:regulator of protease activity HflC (stomatin/prohibitin superfamily)
MIQFIIIAVVAVLVMAKAIIIVPATKRYVITRLGKFLRVAGPGLIVVVPMIDAVAARYDLDTQEVRVDDFVIRYRVLDPKKVFEGVADLSDTVQQSTRTAMRSMLGKPTDVFARRELVNKINGIVEGFGVQVAEVELK